MTKLSVPARAAIQRLQALGAVPQADILFLQTTGRRCRRRADQLKAAGDHPAGRPGLPAGQRGQGAARRRRTTPGQWQTWWWVCIAGQILFLPFIFVMAGRWSPRKAREDERAHEEMVQRELAALQGAGTASSTV